MADVIIVPTKIPRVYADWEGTLYYYPPGGGKWKKRRPQKGRNLKYLRTSFQVNYKRVYVEIHRVVCEAWHGSKPNRDSVVRHLNGNSFDNRAINLCWGSIKENAMDTIRHGKQIRGEKCWMSKFNKEQIIQIRQLHSDGNSYGAIAKMFAVTTRSISLICRRLVWTHV